MKRPLPEPPFIATPGRRWQGPLFCGPRFHGRCWHGQLMSLQLGLSSVVRTQERGDHRWLVSNFRHLSNVCGRPGCRRSLPHGRCAPRFLRLTSVSRAAARLCPLVHVCTRALVRAGTRVRACVCPCLLTYTHMCRDIRADRPAPIVVGPSGLVNQQANKRRQQTSRVTPPTNLAVQLPSTKSPTAHLRQLPL